MLPALAALNGTELATKRPRERPWALVLAGGDGRRLEALTRKIAGAPIPKQYCRITGGRSLLEATLARIFPLVPRERTLVIVNRSHLELVVRGLESRPAYQVAAFHEKPSIELAKQLQRRDALWNSFVMVFHPSRLLALLQQRRSADVEQVRGVIRSGAGYEGVPRWNFSADFLTQIAHHLLVVPVDGVSWSDWGTPEAVEQTLAALRLQGADGHLAESSARMQTAE